MSPSVSHPRVEQIALLTRGLHLPLDPLHAIHLSPIAEALAETWNELLMTESEIALSGDEAEVNAAMATLLNTRFEKDELWAQLVRSVTRGTETINFDGSRLEKRPDLSINLTRGKPSFPLIVECKLLDHPSQKSIAKYCNDGLVRFVIGEYSWAVQEAFMLAYVRDGSTIDSTLTPFLDQARIQPPDPYQTIALPVQVTLSAGLNAAASRHGRSFAYVSQQVQNTPGEIAIWHIWVSTSNESSNSDQTYPESNEG